MTALPLGSRGGCAPMLWLMCACLCGGCEDSHMQELVPVEGAAFAVVSTNYQGASAISLLDVDGEVLRHAWASPGLANAKLRTPLTDDVVLPTVSASARALTTIERSLGVITRFDLDAGAVLGQLKVDANAAARTSYDSNPQDVHFVDEGLAWVSRWSPNPDPEAPSSLRGTDLWAFDPSAMADLDQRIDFSRFNTSVTQQKVDARGEPAGEVESVAYARPARMVATGADGDHLVVGMVRGTLSFAYAGFDYAPGMVAVVDPRAGQITDEIELPGLANCGDVYPVPGAPHRVIVGCIGDWHDLGPRTGLVLLEVDGAGSGTIIEQIALGAAAQGAATPEPAPSAQFVASLGGTRVVAVATGGTDARSRREAEPDRFYMLDLESGQQELLWESDGSFVLGTPAFDADTGLLLLPDAGSSDAPIFGLQRFELDSQGVPVHRDFVEVAPDTTLAARAAHRL